LRRFFAQTIPIVFGRKKTNIIILKSEIKEELSYVNLLKKLTFTEIENILLLSSYGSGTKKVEFT
jgi:hypothetical protein